MIRVRVAEAAGSAPREPGAEMLVSAQGIEGTIGGGALEWEAMGIARQMMREGRATHQQVFPLGPSLGQCCGGSVTLQFEVADRMTEAQGQPLWIWGAGHVGRALVAVLAPLPGFALTWVDIAPERFPDPVPDRVGPLVAADPVRALAHAPGQADHLIVTYSHDLDLRLCDALLRHGFGSCGLIGSATKWARFRHRLAALGHAPEQVARIACPIGAPELGKHPQAIAVGVAAALLGAARGRQTRSGTGG